MLGKILGIHPDVFTFRELHFFDEIIRSSQLQRGISLGRAAKIYALLRSIQRQGYFGPRRYNDYLASASHEVLRGHAQSLQQVYKLFLQSETRLNGRSIACEQTPQNLFHVRTILSAFPNAKIVAMVRDPRAILLSQKNKWRFSLRDKFPLRETIRLKLNYHPITVSRLWNASTREISKWKHHPRVKTIRYEDVVTEPERAISQLCQGLNIDYSSAMLDIPVVGSSNFPDETEGGVRADRAQEWRRGGLSDTEICLCQRITVRGMNAMGYTPIRRSRRPLLALRYNVSLPVHLIAALIFNIRRIKNLGQVLNRLC